MRLRRWNGRTGAAWGRATAIAVLFAVALGVGGCHGDGGAPSGGGSSPPASSPQPIVGCALTVTNAPGFDNGVVRLAWSSAVNPSDWQTDASITIYDGSGRPAATPWTLPVGDSQGFPALPAGAYQVVAVIEPVVGDGPDSQCVAAFTVR